ncbi:MAG: hypothetical protein U0263_23520 [Polyangiaceae bacterium]
MHLRRLFAILAVGTLSAGLLAFDRGGDVAPDSAAADAGSDAKLEGGGDAGRADAGSDAGRDAAPDAAPPPVPACVKVSSQAIFSGSGYDHVVSIENGCDRTASCEITTDVSDETLHATVAPGEREDVVTFRGSPAAEFKASVKCTLAR